MNPLEATQLSLEEEMVMYSVDKMEARIQECTLNSPLTQRLLDDEVQVMSLKLRDDPLIPDHKYGMGSVALYAMATTIANAIVGADFRVHALDIGLRHYPDMDIELQMKTGARILERVSFMERFNGEDGRVLLRIKADILSDHLDALEKMATYSPRLKPMVVKPAPWDCDGKGGGYRSIERPLVSKRHRSAGEIGSKVIASVNKAQAAPFRINQKMLEAAERAGFTDDLPSRRKGGEKAAEFLARKKSINDVNNVNKTTFEIAREYQGYDRIWFTCYLDYRSRLYYCQHYLNPQGNDFSRGLLQFREGKVIGNKKAEKWFLINLANLAGKDKLKLADRVKWANRNLEKMKGYAEDPRKNAGWRAADKPWQFLAACMEVSEYIDKGLSCITYLPVCLDAVCSGIQFWSALLRDEDGAARVSMMPTQEISDIYTDVMNAGKRNMELDGGEDAEFWLGSGLLTRKLYKTPTMTICYSAGKKAFRDFLKKHTKGTVFPNPADNIAYMVDQLLEAIDSVVKVQRGMDFLKACIKDKEIVRYTTPLGFEVVHRPMVFYTNKVSCKVDGKKFQMTLRTPSDRVNKVGLGTAIAPNFIHSLDASLLHMVINSCPEVTSWFMCHDSYGTHAADIPEMATQIRRCFVKMLTPDLLMKFKMEQDSDVPLPDSGTYDLENVKRSPLFFN